MKICASLSRMSDLTKATEADMIEIRLDLVDRVPDTGDKETIITFRDKFDVSAIPKNFTGLIDIGEERIPDVPYRTISSVHDYENTPSSETIAETLNSMTADVSKGAYTVKDFKNLYDILEASKKVIGNRVILGMGEMGEITRIRQNVLGNEFTFAYVGEPTAPGQLSLDEMRALDEDSIITGLAGNPLDKSKSAEMHNAAFLESGISGRFLKFPSPSLEFIGECIRGYGIRGMNVTIPYKESIIPHLDEIDGTAESVGAVNTIVNDNGVLKGYNTDVDGVDAAFKNADFETKGKRILVMGSGGASRACIVASLNNNATVTVTGRNKDAVKRLSSAFGTETMTEREPLSNFDAIVNATPVGMYGTGEYPVNLNDLDVNHTVFDMVYGIETLLVSKAKNLGCKIATGEDMLAMQGARAFELWTGVSGMFGTMRSCL